MDQLKKLGAAVRKLRLAKGLSQEEFAHLANLDRSYIGQIERGVRNLAFGNLVAIAHALDISVSELTRDIE